MLGLALCFCAAIGELPVKAQQAGLRPPHAVVLRATQPESDANLRAYVQVFAAVALAARVAPLSELESLGVSRDKLVLVLPARTARALTAAQADQVVRLVGEGATLVSEEITPLAEKFGFQAGALTEVTQTQETAYPDMMIVWERPGGVHALRPPAGAAVLTREKWSGASLAAVLPYGAGYCLLLATELDPLRGEGYARFPYFTHALRRAGVWFPFRSERLSAFFDHSYRMAADVEYLARKWRRAGIQALHAAAWHFYEPDAGRDAYLERLIAACHRNGILVYAWLELPHVSRAFWEKHPQWREKTAVGQDAHLDWRYLMNLKDPACLQAVEAGLRRLLSRFDWDGVNLGELYFESPQGPENPQRLTPFNGTVRAEFKTRRGVDPLDFFRDGSPHYWKRDAKTWSKFVDYRVEEVRRLNEHFLRLFSDMRKGGKQHLGLALTFVDNVYDTRMREAIGADFQAILPLLDRYDFTLVMEDPGTVWHLGPRRYSELAQGYSRLTRHLDRLGMDINVVERWQDVYPTQRQTGGEFLQLFHHAGRNFRTVLAYFEQSILNQDLDLVSHALASGVSADITAEGAVRVRAPFPVIFDTGTSAGEVRVNGNAWPAVDGGRVLLPAGEHAVTAAPSAAAARPRLVKLNGELRAARYAGDGAIEVSYQASSRAIAIFDRPPKALELDGSPLPDPPAEWVLLPRGSHLLRAIF